MRILVVEDEETVARRLERLAAEILGPRLESLEHAGSLAAAARRLAGEPFDLVFLDLDLCGQDGFDLVRHGLADGGRVVVVSAHRERALEGFDEGVADFVAKPFDRRRLARAIERAIAAGRPAGRGESKPSRLEVRRGGRVYFVPMSEVVFVKGAGDYSRLVLEDGAEHLHESTLRELRGVLPERFERVHRSYLVDLCRVDGLRSLRGSRYRLVLRDGRELPVSRKRVHELRRRLRQL